MSETPQNQPPGSSFGPPPGDPPELLPALFTQDGYFNPISTATRDKAESIPEKTLIFNSDDNEFQRYVGATWVSIKVPPKMALGILAQAVAPHLPEPAQD